MRRTIQIVLSFLLLGLIALVLVVYAGRGADGDAGGGIWAQLTEMLSGGEEEAPTPSLVAAPSSLPSAAEPGIALSGDADESESAESVAVEAVALGPFPGVSPTPVILAPGQGNGAAQTLSSLEGIDVVLDDNGEPAKRAAAVVIDAGTGAAVEGATVLAVRFRGAVGRLPTHLLPLERQVVQTDSEGRVWVISTAFEDLRARLYLQIDHPNYAPAFVVLEGYADGRGGRWLPQEIPLRAASTYAVRIVDSNARPLSWAPVQVTGWREGFNSIDNADKIEVAFRQPRPANSESSSPRRDSPSSGRIITPAPPHTQFTDGSGWLRLVYSHAPVDLEMVDGLHYLHRRETNSPEFEEGRVRVYPFLENLTVEARLGVLASAQVLDADREAVAGGEFSLRLEGMPELRLQTNADGFFQVGLLPFPTGSPALASTHPREGTLTMLSPELFQRGTATALPRREDSPIILPGRHAARLMARLVESAGEGDATAPVLPLGLRTTLDMTLVSRSTDGVLEFVGALPPPGTPFFLQVRGFVPRQLVVPDSGDQGVELDLGEVVLERGWKREFHVGSEFAGGLFHIAPFFESGPPSLGSEFGTIVETTGLDADIVATQRYLVPANGEVTVTGLLPRSYSIVVDPLGHPGIQDVVDIKKSELEEPWRLEAAFVVAAPLTLRGVVVDAAPEWLARARVVERWRVPFVEEPLVFPPYPLPPSGRFESRRFLESATSVHVSVIGPGRESAEAVVPVDPESVVLDAGELTYKPRPRAEFRFAVESFGDVVPPLAAAIEGVDRAEVCGRLRLDGWKLVAENLQPGLYRLRWRIGGVEEVEAFQIRPSAVEQQFDILRLPQVRELVRVLVVDRSGAPLLGARVEPGVEGWPPYFQPEEPGLKLVSVAPQAESEFVLNAPGRLPATVRVPVGGVVPTEVTLHGAARARGTVIDADGRPAEGNLRISWESLTPALVSHGEPVEVPLDRGRFEAFGLPPIPLRFRFELIGTTARTQRELSLLERAEVQDLGELVLGQTRGVRGRVVLPDGGPASDAVVALVRRGDSYRFPLREPYNLEEAKYRAKTDAQGDFRIEGLPKELPEELPEELVLLARAEGYGDGIEDPFDAGLETRVLQLSWPATLDLEVGYLDGKHHAPYRFALEYIADPADPDARVDLGEIAPGFFGLQRCTPVEAGIYRVRWGLRQAYEPIPGLWEEIEIAAGVEGRLRLIVQGRVLKGSAALNGKPLASGWVILSGEPDVPGSARVGRIVDGQYTLIDPPTTFHAFVSVIPEGEPQATLNIVRGEAVPMKLSGYRSALRTGHLDVDYEGYNLTLVFSDAFLARYPEARITYESYEWSRSRFVQAEAEEAIETPRVHFQLLRPGLHTITVRSGRGNLLHNRVVDLREDLEVLVR